MRSLALLTLILPLIAAGAELTTFEAGTTARAADINGNFQALRDEIGANAEAISGITLLPGPVGPAGPAGQDALVDYDPVELNVDCGNGGSVSGALASARYLPNPITLLISGKCTDDNATITRSDVTLRGVTPDAGIEDMRSGVGGIGHAVIASRGASNIIVESLTLKGAISGLTCIFGAFTRAFNVNLVESGRGVLAYQGGTCEIVNSSVSGNVQGVTVANNANAWLRGSIVEDNATAANVFMNSSLNLGSSDDIAITEVRANERGINVFANGAVSPINATISGNSLFGISASTGSVVYAELGTLIIDGNDGDGIHLRDSATALLIGATISNNNGYGIRCSGTTSTDSVFATTTDNTLGDIHPDC